MSTALKIDPNKIDFSLLGDLRPYENQWLAISGDNEIVGHGVDWNEALATVPDRDNVMLFKVLPADCDLIL